MQRDSVHKVRDKIHECIAKVHNQIEQMEMQKNESSIELIKEFYAAVKALINQKEEEALNNAEEIEK